MLISISEGNLITYQKETGSIPISAHFQGTVFAELSKNEQCTRLYNQTKEMAFERMDLIWKCKDTPVVLEEDMTLESVVLNDASDQYVEHYTLLHGHAPENYVKPLAPRDEPIKFIGFTIVPSVPKKINTHSAEPIYKNIPSMRQYSIVDQYGEIMFSGGIDLDTSAIGTFNSEISYGSLYLEFSYEVILKPLSEIEKLYVVVASLIGGTAK